MSYTYRGNHTGPNLFDEPPAIYHPSYNYEALVREERNATMAHYYARGYHDQEIGERVGVTAGTVRSWRLKRGLASNWELVKA